MPPIIYMSPPPQKKRRRRRRNPQKNLMAGDSNQKRRNRNQCAVLLNWTWHLSKVGAVCSRGLYRTSCSSGGNSASSLVSTRYQTCKSVKWDLKKRMHRRKEGGEREKWNSRRRKSNKKRGMSPVERDEKVLPACRRLLKTICRVIFLVFSLSLSPLFFGGPRQVLFLGLWRNEKPTQAKTHIYVGKGKKKSDRLYIFFSCSFYLVCPRSTPHFI